MLVRRSGPGLATKGHSTRIGHIRGGGRPLLREGGPISYEATPSRCSRPNPLPTVGLILPSIRPSWKIPRSLPTETTVESVTFQSKSGTTLSLSNCGISYRRVLRIVHSLDSRFRPWLVLSSQFWPWLMSLIQPWNLAWKAFTHKHYDGILYHAFRKTQTYQEMVWWHLVWWYFLAFRS